MSDLFMVGYFPRIHTALAEFLACLVFVMPLKKGEWKAKDIVLSFVFLSALFLTFYGMESGMAQGFLWTVLMVLGMVEMFVMLYLHYKPDWRTTLYYWSHAFLIAELAASVEWQINYYMIKGGYISHIGQTYILMTLVYLLIFSGIYYIRKKRGNQVSRRITKREAFSAVGIAIGAFIISNIQFALQDSAFSASLGDGVLYARTLVDISGVTMLYANGEQRREMYFRYELDATINLLQRQYEQYQQFESNNEAMHRVYHDLKHQIAYLESETNIDRRKASLREMKEIIRTNESRVNTGNTVLDTLLTSKSLICTDEDILMTCYADAKLIDFMDVMDVCSIFGNTIDNAIEFERTVADIESRLIKIYVGARGVFLLIRIENYCDVPINFIDDTPVSTKADKQLHGFGLKSVRKSVEKYQGHINVEQVKNWFIVTVLIPLPKAEA